MLSFLVGCGAAEAPQLRATPSLPHLVGLPTVPFPLAQSSASFQRVFEGVEEALDDALPEPQTSTEPAYRRWVEDQLAAWLERRGEAILAAENRVRALGSAPEGERAIGQALVAFLAERTREDVLGAPLPNPQSRPERAEALRVAWRERLAPLAETSVRYWRGCAETIALASPELAPWKQRCDDEVEEAAP